MVFIGVKQLAITLIRLTKPILCCKDFVPHSHLEKTVRHCLIINGK